MSHLAHRYLHSFPSLRSSDLDLRQRLLNFYIKTDDFVFPDTTGFAADYSVYNANVISNQYINLDNYILIDRGAKDNIGEDQDRKSTRLNSSHMAISYAVFCLK